ncbi:hypothetical protein AMAG_05298 [Allomyces macrogynus ATCC 38327]|uniref:Cyclin N-terminal domain-containing protein n=1 Tax=Allomyces macrogynus (strain ATCC 38327) TaxID=578462 RepID=A0A0L0SBR6_ALLM3|nr:hypothetical protein AMAG_05298 [Allomyces macrogynus ATCC 38327]|eukprot:KNE59845.1 hypothetical protein AMAG_05298 [Allomyces macrogynus ATCC 38327]
MIAAPTSNPNATSCPTMPLSPLASPTSQAAPRRASLTVATDSASLQATAVSAAPFSDVPRAWLAVTAAALTAAFDGMPGTSSVCAARTATSHLGMPTLAAASLPTPPVHLPLTPAASPALLESPYLPTPMASPILDMPYRSSASGNTWLASMPLLEPESPRVAAMPPPAATGVPDLAVFMSRLVRLSRSSLVTFLVAHCLLARVVAVLTAQGRVRAAAPDTPHRLFLAALLVAGKVADPDDVVVAAASKSSTSNAVVPPPPPASSSSAAQLATICGVYAPREIAVMERVFCKALQYRLHVPPAQLAEHARALIAAYPALRPLGGDEVVAVLDAAAARER